jgi:hypothetical protein
MRISRVSRRNVLKSSDLILIVGAVLAIAMMVSAVRHNRRISQTNMGMNAVTVATV